MRKFLLERVELVRQLIESDLPVHYADCALILCSVMSACAADRWHGKGFDRKRFIELLINRSPPDAHADWVCVPALINRGLIDERDTPYGPGGTRIYIDEEIDLSLADAAATYPGVSERDLKRNCYAALIYEWLRCGYAHNYWGDQFTTHVPPTERKARISYIGRGTKSGPMLRMVSFHLDYLIELAERHAGDVEDTPWPLPATWWIDT